MFSNVIGRVKNQNLCALGCLPRLGTVTLNSIPFDLTASSLTPSLPIGIYWSVNVATQQVKYKTDFLLKDWRWSSHFRDVRKIKGKTIKDAQQNIFPSWFNVYVFIFKQLEKRLSRNKATREKSKLRANIEKEKFLSSTLDVAGLLYLEIPV